MDVMRWDLLIRTILSSRKPREWQPGSAQIDREETVAGCCSPADTAVIGPGGAVNRERSAYTVGFDITERPVSARRSAQ